MALTKVRGQGLESLSDGVTITTADNTDQLTLTSTDADANSGPNLRLYRNSSSPADDDFLGTIDFEGRNDNSQDFVAARIFTFTPDVSDGSEDAQLQLSMMKGGSSHIALEIKPDEFVINNGSVDIDFRVESNGQTHKLFVNGGEDVVCFGFETPETIGGIESGVQIEGTDYAGGSLSIWRNANDDAGGYLQLGKSRGTAVNSDTIVQDNDDVGIINFIGAGDPKIVSMMGKTIIDVTNKYDELVLNYLKENKDCLYIYISSGAVYGKVFESPAKFSSLASIPINTIHPADYYSFAKLNSEYLHRAHADLNIIDIRLFNFFSRNHDENTSFFMSDVIRSIKNNLTLEVGAEKTIRDYMHPKDFFQLISLLLLSKPINTAIDCYSKDPVDKVILLKHLKEKFHLKYSFTKSLSRFNGTGNKPYYFSIDRKARDFGYTPKYSSLETVLSEMEFIIQ